MRAPGLRRAAAALPTLLLVGAFLLTLATPPRVTFAPFLAAAPLVAAAVQGLRATVITACAAVAMATIMHIWIDPSTSLEAVFQVLTVATVSAMAVGINQLVGRRTRQVLTAREVAAAVQRAMVPDPPPAIDGVRLATRYRTADREALIGGDLYGAVQTPHGVRLILGDVRGKGLEATDSVAVVLGAFREAAEYETSLGDVSARVDSALRRAARLRAGRLRLGEDESFVTGVLLEFHPGDLPGTGTGAGTGTGSGTSAGIDTGTDAGTDAGTGSGTSAGIDTGTDAGTDAGTGSGTSAGIDTGAGAGAVTVTAPGAPQGTPGAHLPPGSARPPGATARPAAAPRPDPGAVAPRAGQGGGPAPGGVSSAVSRGWRPDPGLPHGDPSLDDLPVSEVRVMNQGHPPPLLLLPDGGVRALTPAEPALPFGLLALGGGRAEPARLLLPPGAVLVLYTDGLSEARDAQGRFYDPETRLLGCPTRDPDEVLDWLIADVTRHGGLGHDDLALMAVRAAAPGRPVTAVVPPGDTARAVLPAS
ncbi:PP2C family protein-serine/threonine phosphatase [Streptomyces lonarensis]|uniref:PP2C family protein-serine/threonine phosphatase n=1 Tax=Streptomyces lonarensis TaxID=700599 RepID=UPI001ADD7F67|nr:SpoIIE family protein phosphatase [Streptomyces lonarensis]